jgi:hypothetical protein
VRFLKKASLDGVSQIMSQMPDSAYFQREVSPAQGANLLS